MVAMRLHPVVRNWEAMRHEDVRSVGYPDLSLTGSGRTTWWEFKHAMPKLKANEAGSKQHLCMMRLEQLGFARYIIWLEDEEGKQSTLIVCPQYLADFRSKATIIIAGYAMKGVVEWMKLANERRAI